jgi:hypothetical protein
MTNVEARMSKEIRMSKVERRRHILSNAVISLLQLLLCGLTTHADTLVQVVRVPDEGRQPCVEVGGDGIVHLIYLKGDPKASDIFYTSKTPEAEGFAESLRVNSQRGSAVMMGTVRGPRLALGTNGQVHVAWMGSKQAMPRGPEDGAPMLYTHLNTERTAFEKQRNVLQTSSGLDGGGTVAADDKGNVYVVWHGNGMMEGEAFRKVYVVISSDGGRTFSKETIATPEPTGACACCGIEAHVASSGQLCILYRAATRMLNRDMWWLTSGDEGRSFEATQLDRWREGSCPMSTSKLVDARDGLWAVWENNGRIRFGELSRQQPASEERATPEWIEIKGESVLKHPALAVNDRGEMLVAWAEGTAWNRGGRVQWQRYDANGRPVGDVKSVEGLPAWSKPAVYARGGQFVILY